MQIDNLQVIKIPNFTRNVWKLDIFNFSEIKVFQIFSDLTRKQICFGISSAQSTPKDINLILVE
jgi:hypothetical protein